MDEDRRHLDRELAALADEGAATPVAKRLEGELSPGGRARRVDADLEAAVAGIANRIVEVTFLEPRRQLWPTPQPAMGSSATRSPGPMTRRPSPTATATPAGSWPAMTS